MILLKLLIVVYLIPTVDCIFGVGASSSAKPSLPSKPLDSIKNGLVDAWDGVAEGNNLLGIIIRATTKEGTREGTRERTREGRGRKKSSQSHSTSPNPSSSTTVPSPSSNTTAVLTTEQLARRSLRRLVDSKFKTSMEWGMKEIDRVGAGEVDVEKYNKGTGGEDYDREDEEGGEVYQEFRPIIPSSSILHRFCSLCQTSVHLRWYSKIPCILCRTTIPLPFEDVMGYLGDEGRVREYNEFLGNRELGKDRGVGEGEIGKRGSWYDVLEKVGWDDRGIRVGKKRDGCFSSNGNQPSSSGDREGEALRNVMQQEKERAEKEGMGGNSTLQLATTPNSPSSPLTWYIFPPKLVYGESPKILFVPPRSFLSMVQLRVLRKPRSRSLAKAFTSTSPSTQSTTPSNEGEADHTSPFKDVTSVIVTQYGINATDYEAGKDELSLNGPIKIPPRLERLQRANTIRSMSVITRTSPNTTSFSLIAHSDPGGGLPFWAVRKVVGTLVGIEPFRFFHRVTEGAGRRRAERLATKDDIEYPEGDGGGGGGGGGNYGGRERIGISQMGYAAFWEMPERWGSNRSGGGGGEVKDEGREEETRGKVSNGDG